MQARASFRFWRVGEGAGKELEELRSVWQLAGGSEESRVFAVDVSTRVVRWRTSSGVLKEERANAEASRENWPKGGN